MRLEFHQLDRRYEHLRARCPARQRRLLASLAEAGKQTPIVVVAVDGDPERYLVIDGHQRIAALRQLGRDTVAAVVWPLGEADALLLERSLRPAERETALEQGWLLAEMERRFGYGIAELARRFDRSVSWVSRRLALVELLPESIQQQVRAGQIAAQTAMKYLAPVARSSLVDCQRMAAICAARPCTTRQAGQLYDAWRKGSPAARQSILAAPELFFKTQQQAPEPAPAGPAGELARDLEMVAAILNRATRRQAGAAATELDHAQRQAARQQLERLHGQLQRLAATLPLEQESHVEPIATDDDPRPARRGSEPARDRPAAGCLAADGAPGAAVPAGRRAGDPPAGEGRTVPAAHPGAVAGVQGEPRASP
jgi:ParB family transcriptional regulator, chromosome partitioning protein